MWLVSELLIRPRASAYVINECRMIRYRNVRRKSVIAPPRPPSSQSSSPPSMADTYIPDWDGHDDDSMEMHELEPSPVDEEADMGLSIPSSTDPSLQASMSASSTSQSKKPNFLAHSSAALGLHGHSTVYYRTWIPLSVGTPSRRQERLASSYPETSMLTSICVQLPGYRNTLLTPSPPS